MIRYSTLTVTDGSSIDNNTAEVSSRRHCRSWLIHKGEIDARSLRKSDFAMFELSEETQRLHARPLAVRRRRLRVFFIHACGDGRLEHRRQHRYYCEPARVAVAV